MSDSALIGRSVRNNAQSMFYGKSRQVDTEL